MFNLLALSWSHYAFSIPLSVLSVFLMLVILVQRGRGGGLTGALGGMGGQSAFGTKAGDLFTRITIAVAAIWILLSMVTLKVLNNPPAIADTTPPAATAPGDAAKDKAATDNMKVGDKDATMPATGDAPAARGDTKSGEATPMSKTPPPPPRPESGNSATLPVEPAPPATSPPTATPPATTPPAADASKTNP